VACQCSFYARLLDSSGTNGTTEAIVQARNRRESCGADLLEVIHKGENVAMEVSNFTTGPESTMLGHTGVDMC